MACIFTETIISELTEAMAVSASSSPSGSIGYAGVCVVPDREHHQERCRLGFRLGLGLGFRFGFRLRSWSWWRRRWRRRRRRIVVPATHEHETGAQGHGKKENEVGQRMLEEAREDSEAGRTHNLEEVERELGPLRPTLRFTTGALSRPQTAGCARRVSACSEGSSGS